MPLFFVLFSADIFNAYIAVNRFLVNFENLLGVGPVRTAKVLGIAYPTYAAYKSGARALPTYCKLHCDALRDHPDLVRKIEERLK